MGGHVRPAHLALLRSVHQGCNRRALLGLLRPRMFLSRDDHHHERGNDPPVVGNQLRPLAVGLLACLARVATRLRPDAKRPTKDAHRHCLGESWNHSVARGAASPVAEGSDDRSESGVALAAEESACLTCSQDEALTASCQPRVAQQQQRAPERPPLQR